MTLTDRSAMLGRHPLGTVANLWLYPVKSLAPQAPARAALDTNGFLGDRASALFVATPEHARAGRPYRGKEHNLLHTLATPARAIDAAAERHVEIEERRDGPHFDAEPVSLITDRWLAELEALAGRALDPLRFRPNLFVRADASFAASESEPVGAVIVAGDAELEVVAPISRCVTITYDIATGTPDPAIHRTLTAHRDNVMGIYCRPRGPGSIGVGDRLQLLSG